MRLAPASIGARNGGAAVSIGRLAKRTEWCDPQTEKPVRVKTMLATEIRNALRYFDIVVLTEPSWRRSSPWSEPTGARLEIY